LDKHLKINLNMHKKIAQIKIAEAIFKREYNRIIEALGGVGHHLVDQYELQRLGHPYYNSRAAGGEGHLEVAKNIYYSHKGLAHMVLALKPFGCMPSTQSDGAQSAVMSHYKDMIFLPIETSGEGDVNAHSRVQMALGEAKAKTKLEFKASLESTGRSLEEIKAYVEEHAELKSAMHKIPRVEGVVGGAATFVRHVADRMKADGIPARAASSVAA
jgi:predicted nucleotide-binding protein (sugar kinase/HSP70/actin superfamily)